MNLACINKNRSSSCFSFTSTTAHDNETLIPDILQALNKTDIKPNIAEHEWTYNEENEIEIYTDGSYDDKNQKGTYAIIVGPEHRNACIIVPRAYSSFEVEIRGIIHALSIVPWGKSIVIYTDSANSIDAIKTKYTGNNPKKRKVRDEKLIERTLELIKKKEVSEAKVKICFVYSHLRDEENEQNRQELTHEKKKEKERKEKIMKDTYGEKAERILLGNKKADILTQKTNNSPHLSQYSAVDPKYVIRIDGRDSTWKTRAACYEHLVAIELQQNRNSHPDAYDWLESDKIEKITSQILLTDNSRKLTKTRHFMFKLRNNKLKTMEKMNQRYISNKRDSHYAKQVLAKYTTEMCPLCEIAKETDEHITKCFKTTNIRDDALKKIYKLIQNNTKEIREDDTENSQMITEPVKKNYLIEKKIRKWLLAEDKNGWKKKWGWLGYMKKDLVKFMGKITWNDDQNTFTIIKKIQIIIIEALQECWLRRCKKLHSQELSGDAINILRDRAETKWKHISTKSQKPTTSTPTITTKERNFLSHNCTLIHEHTTNP